LVAREKKLWKSAKGKNFALLTQNIGVEMKTFGPSLGKNQL